MFLKNRARAEAWKFIRKLKGNISYTALEQYISDWYSIVFFNTPFGDNEIKRYNLECEKSTLKAFTYSQVARIIFIDGNKHPDDRLYLLLHEIGHIILGHIGDGKLVTRNKFFMEFEADAFAYEILIHCQLGTGGKKHKMKKTKCKRGDFS